MSVYFQLYVTYPDGTTECLYTYGDSYEEVELVLGSFDGPPGSQLEIKKVWITG